MILSKEDMDTRRSKGLMQGYLHFKNEVAADKLVAEWGFKIPKRR